ncbi:hypothetical protein [Myroides phaeus]|uniref:hypothetical protein n=1 Tax=Myroides phaeus TaxID=702745 RepID=UPI001303AF19|nr:hypothetical protein [Myroides phaeus]
MKVSHIIKSPSYDSDGRLQKWIRGFSKVNIKSNVYIIEDSNTKSIEKLGDTILVKDNLWFRNFFKQRKGYLFKSLEYMVKVKRFISKYKSDIIVFHDVQQYLNLLVYCLFFKTKKCFVIWDLHELPHSFIFRTMFTKKLLKYVLESVDLVIYTNDERKEYLRSKLNYSEKDFKVLNNYPDLDFLEEKKNSFPIELFGLRKNIPYILWLGGALKGRNFGFFIEAYRKVSDRYNLVVLGKVEKEFNNLIEEGIQSKKIYNSFVKQEELIKFIDNACFSVVLYNDRKPNSFYCEPNRLYQLIYRKVPVIVGNNPTMKNIVEKLDVGLVLSDDGSSIENIVELMNDINTDKLKENLENLEIKDVFSWEKQFNEILRSIYNNENIINSSVL